MAVTMINSVDVCQKEFEDSHLLAKLKKAVIVARIVGDSSKDPTYIHSITKLDLSAEMYEAVKADYKLVRSTLLDPKLRFQALTGRMGIYIQLRTKGCGHGSKTRSFYARPKFLEKFINISKTS